MIKDTRECMRCHSYCVVDNFRYGYASTVCMTCEDEFTNEEETQEDLNDK